MFVYPTVALLGINENVHDGSAATYTPEIGSIPKKWTHWDKLQGRILWKLSLISKEKVEETPTVTTEARETTERVAHAADGTTET